MLKMAPMAVDDDSMAQATEALERQLNGMAENLGQYQPMVGLTPEGRLMYALVEDPNGPTNEMYPVGGYAKPLKPETITPRHRLRRVAGNTRRLMTKMGAFAMTHGLPGGNNTSIEGQAMALGFMAASGLDVCWNGKGWHVTAGVYHFSPQVAAMTPEEDIIIKAQDFPAATGMFFVRFGVQMLPEGGVKIFSAKVEFKEGTEEFAIQSSSDFAIDGSAPVLDTYKIAPATVVSPLAYVLAPEGDRRAPVVLRAGDGAAPTDYSYAVPTSLASPSARPYYP